MKCTVQKLLGGVNTVNTRKYVAIGVEWVGGNVLSMGLGGDYVLGQGQGPGAPYP